MKKRNDVLIGEWFFGLWGPAKGRSGPVTIVVGNAEPKDRAMVEALAKVAAVWLNAARRPS